MTKTREEAAKKLKDILVEATETDECDFYTREKEPCKDWHDVPSDEMTLEQARQAVKDLRKKLREYLDQKPCDDCISRQWLMECVDEGWIKFDTEKDENTFVHLVRDIAPPVTPQPKPKMEESEGKEFCEDAISRQAVEEMIKAEMPERGTWMIEGDTEKDTVCEVCADLIQKLSALPSVTSQPKIGRWIARNSFLLQYKCSECGWESEKYNYCPNCGAEMRDVEK